MVCGNFRESICKEIGLNDVKAERLLKLLQLACGRKGIVAMGIEELLDLGELADRLQMEAVRSKIENMLLKELTVENCLEMFKQSEARGLKQLQKECYKKVRDKLGVISKEEGFLKLSEETMGALLEEDELGVSGEEDVFEAVVRWVSNSEDRLSVEMMLKRIRYRIIGADVLKSPEFVAIDGQGRLLVSDTKVHAIIVFNHNGSVAQRLGSKGKAAGQFDRPMGVAVDRRGHIVVADHGNRRIQVLNADGSVTRCFGFNGGYFDGPWGVEIDREGHIVVAHSWNHRVQVFDAGGSVLRHFGSYGAAIGQLHCPSDVAIDGEGRIVVVDCNNHRVQVFNGNGSVALCFGSQGDGPGQLVYPSGVAVDNAGRYVVSDRGNGRVQVFNPDGSVERVVVSEVDGVGKLRCPYGVVVDGAGRIIVVDLDNNRVQVL